MDILWARNLLRPADFGGSRYHWEVTRRLAARGHRVRVVVPRPSGPLPGPTAAQLHHFPVSRRNPLFTFATNVLFSQPAIRAELGRSAPDAVVLSSYDVAYGYSLLGPRKGPPSIFIYHSSFFSDAVQRLDGGPARRVARRWLQWFMRHVEARIFRQASLLIAVSPFSRAEIEQRLGGVDERIRLVPTGVDTDLFSPGDRMAARSRLGLPSDGRILVTAGRLAPVKRYDRAIDALAIIRKGDSKCLLVLAGAGPAEAELRARAAPLGDAVRFAGFADGERLRDLYRAADLVLCTSDFENWSVAVLEALASGTPVVGTPRGSIPDLLGLIDSDLVLADVQPATLAAKIEDLFRFGRLEELGVRAAERVGSSFSWDRTAEQIEACIAEVGKSR